MRRALARVWTAGGIAIALSPTPHAARLPDWAQAIADAAPQVEAGAPKHPRRVLLAELRLRVEPDGSFRLRRRLATQALIARAEETGLGFFHRTEGAKVKASRGWHLPPGEKAEKSGGPVIDVTLDDSFLTDSRTRIVALEGVKKGSLLFFEFETVEMPVALSYEEVLYEGAPIQFARVEVEAPPEWAVRHAWLRREGPDPQLSGGVRTWELRDLPNPEEEPLGDPALSSAPILALTFTPPAGSRLGPASHPDWVSLSRWFEEIARGRDAPTSDVEEAARATVPGRDSSFLESVLAASTFVRDRVRYVAKEVGIGGYQPRPAGQVVRDLYGDCKDKGTLLRAILASRGLVSYPILVNASAPETVSEEIPHIGAFNHLVVGVSVPPRVELSPRHASAVVDAGDLGRLLMVDTTAEYTSPGTLPAALAGKRALVVAGERGRLVTLPPGDPSAHRIGRRLDIEVQPDRSLVVRVEDRYVGESATAARASHRVSSADRRKEVERALLDIWHDAAIGGYSAESERADGAFVETVDLFVPAAPVGTTVPLFPGAVESLPRVPLGKRQTAVSYAFPRTITVETTLRGIPETTPLPQGLELRGEGWSATLSVEKREGAIRGVWEVVLSRTRFESDAFAELKRLWSAASKTASPLLPLGL